MTPRLARRLVAVYPRSWRDRYEQEFAALLEGEAFTAAVILNIIGAACREHVRAFEFDMKPAQRVRLLMYACLAAMAAGVNLFWTVDDTPIGPAMRVHAAFATSWNMVAWGSAFALAAAFAVAVPVLRKLITAAVANRQHETVARLLVPFCAAAILLGWMSIVIARTHWAPMPWNITGTWAAPASWPSLTSRWILGSVTGLVMACGLVASAMALGHAIDRAEPMESLYLRVALGSLAAVLAVMAAGAAAWGALAQVYAPAAFHSRVGGIFGSSISTSWIISLALLVGAVAIAVRGSASSWNQPELL